MTSVDSNFNFLCGHPHGAGPPSPVHMRSPESDPLRVDIINGWPLIMMFEQCKIVIFNNIIFMKKHRKIFRKNSMEIFRNFPEKYEIFRTNFPPHITTPPSYHPALFCMPLPSMTGDCHGEPWGGPSLMLTPNLV